MFGLIHDSLKQLMIRLHGEDFWLTVLQHANIEAGTESLLNVNYPDEVTLSIVDSISILTRTPCEEIWETYGEYFVEYVIEAGWDELLRSMSPNLKGFLNNLDSMHYFIDNVVYKANMRGPSFRCEESGDEIILHYLSTRSGLYPIVKGVLKEIARKIYKSEIGMTVKGRTQRAVQFAAGERIEEHVIFQIKLSGTQKTSAISSNVLTVQNSFDPSIEWTLKVNTTDFGNIMPYHLIVDQECKLVNYGSGLKNHIPVELLEVGTPLLRIFEIHRPQIPLDYENICNFINGVFVMQTRNMPLAVQHQGGLVHAISRNSHSSVGSKTSRGDEFTNAQHLKLKGQMVLINNGANIVYLAKPYVMNVDELIQYGLKLSAFPLHDSTRDLILMNQQRLNDAEDNVTLEEKNKKLEKITKELEEETIKLNNMIAEDLPPQVLHSLEAGNAVLPREFDEVTILYSDVPNFDVMMQSYAPAAVIAALDELFIRFGRLVQLHNIFKINGIAESYLAVGGIPEPKEDHAETILHIALGMEWKARQITIDTVKNEPMLVRCGIHSGSVIAGIVEMGSPKYCIFGETVNKTSRLALNINAGQIVVSNVAKECAERTGRFEFEDFDALTDDLDDPIEAFYLKKSLKKSVWEIISRERDENINSIDGYLELNEVLQPGKKREKVKFCSIL